MDDVSNESGFNNLDHKNSKKFNLLYDEKPEIVSYGKSAATDIGDFMCSFIECMLLRSQRMSDEIREYSIQYTSPLIPNLKDQQASNSLYERGIIPTDFPSSKKQKESCQNFEGVISLGQKFTDDTFFDKNAYATCLEHDEEYQLSQDIMYLIPKILLV